MSKKRRMIVIAGLVMAMTSATVPAVLMTGCKKQTTPANKQITGEYYAETDNFILQLYGTDYTFDMYVNGVKSTGSYTYKGNTLTLTIGGNVVIATVDKNKENISLKYDDKNYDLAQTSIRTLSFDTNGAAAIDSQLVADGNKGVRPSEPSKSGYLFLGWYESDNTTPFDFDAALTEDKTAYAKFVQIDSNAQNYTVTFNAGAGATLGQTTATTVNGKIYDSKLPVPVKAGSTFVGWWVSHYGTAEKLTYKYNEQVLKEDTTFYAVWDTDLNGAPAVSVTSSGVTWSASGSANQYAVAIYNTDNVKVVDVNRPSTSYDYDFTTKDAGDYRVEVTLNGKTTTAYFKNKSLDKVSGFSWEGTTLTFDAVAGATDYYITVECGNAAHVHTDVHLTGTSYDFSACEMKKGGIKFTVKASGEGYATSSAEYTIEKNLPDVTGLTVDKTTETLKWNAVENATSYDVEITNGAQTKTYTITGTSYNLKFLTGEILYKVTAKAHGFNASAAANGTYNKITLASPSNLALVGGEIKWDAVAGASKYVISVNGTEREVSENKISTDNELFDKQFGTYTIYVTAVGSSSDKNSLQSDKFEVTIGGMGTVSYNNGTVSWGGVLGAVKYGVKVNDGTETIVDDANQLKVTFSKKGKNVISVRCYSDDDTTSEWADIEVQTYAVKLDTLGGYQIGDTSAEFITYYLAEGDELTLPESALKTGYTFDSWYTTRGGAADGGQQYGATATFDKDTTVYAYFTANKYNVTIVATGGILPEGTPTEFEVTFGSAFSLPVPQAESGTLAFNGWYAEYNVSTSVKYCGDDGSSVRAWNTANNDLVLFPVWIDIFKFTLKTDAATKEEYYVVEGLDAIKKVRYAKVPATYEGKPVLRIEGDCFKGCSVLKTVEIPDTLTDIALGEYGYSAAGSAFSQCANLEEINVYHVAGTTDVKYFSVDGVLYSRLSETSTEAQILYCPHGITGTLNIAKTVGGEVDGDDLGTYDVTTIGVNVLKSSSFNKVYIPSSITTISDSAFGSCYNLASIVFLAPSEDEEAASLTINGNAFSSCSGLRSVTFPKRLADFNRAMFDGATGLRKVYVSDEEGVDGVGTNYSSVDGLLCNAAQNTIIFAGKGVGGEEGNFTIPAGITTIGEYAFHNCINIKNITIPGYVTKIEQKAFMLNPYIASINFQGDENDADLEIEDYAFCSFSVDKKYEYINYNTVLTDLTLPANLKKMGTGVFGGYSALTEVTVNCNRTAADEDSKAADYALNAMDIDITSPYTQRTYSAVTTVNLGKDCPEIEVGGIFGTKIETVNVHEDNPYYYSEDGVLYNKSVTSILYFPMAKGGDFEIPDTVTTIGGSVFAGRNELTKVTIPGSVTLIGEEAFYNCSKLQEIIFEEGTEDLTIGVDAFRYCTSRNFTQIDIPARCTSIGQGAFRQCTYLETVTLHEGLEEIGDEAFYLCYALKGITIPATCVKMGTYDEAGNLTAMNVFKMYSMSPRGDLAYINVAAGNTAFASHDGVLYLLTEVEEESAETQSEGEENGGEENGGETSTPVKKATDLLVCPAAKEGAVEILSTVKNIWSYAFQGTHKITEISFEEGFSGNFELGENVFEASSLNKITLPEGLKTIVEGMFKNCISLEQIVIPSTVTKIGKSAFLNCTGLRTLTFAPVAKDAVAQPLVFEACDAITGTGSSGGTGSSASIFYGCINLKTLDIPERTTEIGDYAFSGSSFNAQGAANNKNGYLEEVSLPSTLTKIGKYAFYKNVNLSTLTFADAATEPAEGTLTIGDFAFNTCKIAGVKKEVGTDVSYELKLPNTLKEIGVSAFQSSGTFTSVNIPANLETIGTSAFKGLTKLKTVVFKDNGKLEEIGTTAFEECTGLTTIDFTKAVSLLKIGDKAFSKCSSLEGVKVNDTKSTVSFDGTKLTDIGAQAFKGCSAITSVTLPATIVNLGNTSKSGDDCGAVFMDCSRLSSVTFLTKEYELNDESEEENDGEETTQTVKKENRSDLVFVGYHCFANTALTEFSFPISTSSSIDISSGYQFADCPSLTTISLSRSVKNLSNLFANCTSIETIEIASDSDFKVSDNSSVPFILSVSGTEIVYGYAAVTTTSDNDKYKNGGVYDLSKTNFTSINSRAFEGQSGIKKIILPASLQRIDEYAFANCRQLEEVVFANGTVLHTIGNNAFEGCTKLKSISLPYTVETIGEQAFARCNSLKTVTIGTSVDNSRLTEIGQKAFLSCTSLTEATIYCKDSTTDRTVIGTNTSSSTTNLYKTSYMFLFCTSLQTVKIYGTPWLGTYMFDHCTSLQTVVLDDRLTELPGYMFQYCTSLTTMKVLKDGVETGEKDVITLPSGLTSLGHKGSSSNKYMTGYTFLGCSAMTKVILPAGLEYLGTYSFQNCNNLATVTYVDDTQTADDNDSGTNSVSYACSDNELILPTTLKSIGYYAFDNTGVKVAKLENLGDFSEHNTGSTSYENLYLFENCAQLEKVTFSKSLTQLYGAMFYMCPNLKTINYYDEDSNTYVGEDNVATFWEGLNFLGFIKDKGTFQGCGFIKVIIPSTLKTINNTASTSDQKTAPSTAANTFRNNVNLTTVVLTSKTYCIGAYVFSGCTSLKRIEVAADDTTVNFNEVDTFKIQEFGSAKLVANTSEDDADADAADADAADDQKFIYSSSNPKIVAVDENGRITAVAKGTAQITITDEDGSFTKTFTVTVEEAVTAIPSTVVVLGQYAFQNTGITKLELPTTAFVNPNTNGGPSITSWQIGTYAFMDCAELKEVTYGYNVAVPGSMFKNCTELETVTLSASVTSLGANAFEGCTSLETINVSGDTTNNATGVANLKNVGTLASQIFLNCSSLEKVILKNAVISFNYKETFKGCTSLTTIDTLGDTANNKEGTANLLKITTAGTTTSYLDFFNGCAFTEVYMPALATGGYNMFRDCKNLTTVTISANLKNINFGMFDGCEKLTTIYTNGDTANNEEGKANLSKITRFATTATGTTAADYAFRDTAISEVKLTNLERILGKGIFEGTGITEFEVGEKVSSIGAGAFSGCDGITAFTVAAGNTAYKAVNGAIYTADGSYLIAFPAGYTGEFVLEEGALGGQDGALDGYHGVTKSFTLPVVETLPAMSGLLAKSGIENLIIPEGVVTIPDNAFKDIPTLKSVVIPSTVTTIGKSAFANCTSLETVTFTPAAEGVEEVPLTFTAGSITAKAVVADIIVSTPGAFSGCTALKSIVIPERVTVIPKCTFADSGLESITLHSNLTEIQEYAFLRCASLKTLDIPNGLTNLGSAFTTLSAAGYIFAGCNSLTKVTLPGTLKYTTAFMFKECTALTTVNYHDATTGEVVGNDGDVTLPAGLQFISESLFESCTALNPSKITINMSDGEKNIGSHDVGYGVFLNCTGIKNVTIEGNLLVINKQMFKGCSSLTSIKINAPVTNIGEAAFEDCSALESFTIPETVTSLTTVGSSFNYGSSRLFAGCTSLKKLVIPATVTSLDGYNATSSTLERNGMFNGWTSDQIVIIECNTFEMINWKGFWYVDTNATILYKTKGEPDPEPEKPSVSEEDGSDEGGSSEGSDN